MAKNRLLIRNELTGKEVVLANYSLADGWVQSADIKKLVASVLEEELELKQRQRPRIPRN